MNFGTRDISAARIRTVFQLAQLCLGRIRAMRTWTVLCVPWRGQHSVKVLKSDLNRFGSELDM